MIKTTRRNKATLRANSKSTILKDSPKLRSASKSDLPETSKPTRSPEISNGNTQRLRNCVVKIKRIKHKSNDSTIIRKSQVRLRNEDFTKGPLESTCEENALESSTAWPSTVLSSTPCKVLLRRLDATQLETNANNSKKNLESNEQEQPHWGARLRRKNVKEKAPIMDDKPSKGRGKDKSEVQKEEKRNDNELPKGYHRFFHRDQPPTRSRSSVLRNVYDFLSESQIDDNNLVPDPASDVIKKMVEDGRVCALMRMKSGKYRKRRVKRKVRPVGKRRQCSLKCVAEEPSEKIPSKEPTPHKLPLRERPLSPIYEPELVDEERPPSPIYNPKPNLDDDTEVPPIEPIQAPQDIPSNTNRTLLEGSYSPLARSMLLNQTKTNALGDAVKRRLELLKMARKYYSTPLNPKLSKTNNKTLDFSPIIDPFKNRRTTPANFIRSPNGDSPWRVTEESQLPNTFAFGLNTSQLPSYSSDYIQRRRNVYVPDEADPVADSDNDSNCPVLPETSNRSAANDSNGENVPPPEKTIEAPGQQESENEENIVQLPNPRRTLQQRAPLKDINILDVVVLPSWKKNMQLPKTPIKDNMASNHVRFEDSIENIIANSPRNQMSPQSSRPRQSSQNLFGFEEFLNEEDSQRKTIHGGNQNITLTERLQRLKHLRPTTQEQPVVSKDALRYDYDDLTANMPKQRNIKEMLCSTMVAPSPHRARGGNESANLFKDMDPETTFDESKPRRTYVREQPKRKRKRVHVLFVETDSSDNDDEGEQDSHDKHDDSPAKARRMKKRPRKDLEQETKLRQFITSFNKECEEVEQFPLIIE